jgi:hypothetical protein
MVAGTSGDRGTRLRDLDARARLLAALVGVLLVLPVAVSAGRAIADHWVPSGDEAVIAVRVHDALTSDPPLTGLPSTSDLYGSKIRTRHLGPSEFYLLAVPERLLGPQLGLLLGAGAITAAALLIAAWVALRRAGPGVALGVSVLLVLTTWSTGTAVLTDPISSNVGGYPLLAAAVLAWALLLGDIRLLPLAVAVISFAAQQHLAMVMPAAAVAVIAGAGVVGTLWSRWSVREERSRTLAWIGGALAVGAVMWLPVAIDQVTGHPGNLTAIARFSGDGRSSLTTADAVNATLRAAGPPPLQLAHDLTGHDLIAPVAPIHVAAALVVLAGMAVLSVVMWRRERALAALGPVALAMAVAGFAATTNVPDSLEAFRINLYRWSWVLAFVVWWAIGWVVARAVARAVPASGLRTAPDGAIGAVMPYVAVATMVVVLATSLGATGADDARRDATAFGLDRRLGDVAARSFSHDGPVMVVDDGTAANLSVAPALIARLVDDGVTVQVPGSRADAYGDARTFDPRTARSVLLVASRFGALDGIRGEKLAEYRLTPQTALAVDRLVEAARSAPVRRSAKATELHDNLHGPVAALADTVIDNMGRNPSGALSSPVVLRLLLDGYLDSPRFDRADLQAVLDGAPQQRTLWGDDRVGLYRLTLDELRRYRPELFR